MSDPTTDWTAVMARLATASRARSEADIARLLGLSTGDFAQRKGRGRIPWDRVIGAASSLGVSVDWLATGKEEMGRGIQEDPADWQVPTLPAGLAGQEQRIGALLTLLGQIDPGHREAILTEALSRATLAQRVAVLDQAVQELLEAKRA